MPLEPNYNKDFYNPEMYDPDYNMKDSERMNLQAMREAKIHEEKMEALKSQRDIEFNEELPYLKRKFFAPLDLISSEDSAASQFSKRAFYVGIAVFCIWIYLFIVLINYSTQELKIPMPFYIIGMGLILILLQWVIWSRLYFNVETKRRKRAVLENGVKRSDLSNVWKINPNGISKTTVDGKEFTKVLYSGKSAIVLKLVRQSILTSEETADIYHYRSLEEIENILTRSDLIYTKILKQYDTENDYMWQRLNKNMENSSILGAKYTSLMHDILTYHMELTKEISRLNVIYYVIQPSIKIKSMTLEDAVRKIHQVLLSSRMSVESVSYNEFLSVLKDYYGVEYLDIDKITERLDTDTTFTLDVELIRYLDSTGELVKLQDLPSPKLPTIYREPTAKMEFAEEEEKYNLFENLKDIFNDNVYEQPQTSIRLSFEKDLITNTK